MVKPTLAVVNTTGCTGCVISILDLNEDLLKLLDLVDLVYCTTILDVKELPQCDFALVNGTIANKHDVEIAKEAEKKAKKIIALGSCACFGGITGLRNYPGKDETLNYSYGSVPSNDSELIPTEVPELTEYVEVLKNIIHVDYSIPGCPPVPSMFMENMIDIVNGENPKIPTRNLCAECNKKHDRMLVPTKEFLTFQIYSPNTVDFKEDLCFLEQGILCIGYATKEGCNGRCVNANVPCRGCMGPLEKEVDQGCAGISGLASIFPIGQLIDKEDLSGTMYRYSLPYSILHSVHKKNLERGGKK